MAKRTPTDGGCQGAAWRTLEELAATMVDPADGGAGRALELAPELAQVVQDGILAAYLRRHGGNLVHAAESLGVPVRTAQYWLQRSPPLRADAARFRREAINRPTRTPQAVAYRAKCSRKS
jgi:hypothetical protein